MAGRATSMFGLTVRMLRWAIVPSWGVLDEPVLELTVAELRVVVGSLEFVGGVFEIESTFTSLRQASHADRPRRA